MTERAADAPIPALFQTERQHEIVTMTMQTGRVEVAELAERFGVTTETIRRDLSDLQNQRVVRRVHGGAIPWETAGFEPLLSVRTDLHDSEKRRIARRALDEVPDTGAIIIDSGSTLTRFAETIPPHTELRVVTNSLLTAQVLANHELLDVIVIGGKVRKNTLAMVDAEAVATVEPLVVDTLFISSDGLTPATGLTTPYREEAALKRAMIRAARRVVALVDHSKIGQDHFIRFAQWSDIDVLITNTEVEVTTLASIEALGTTVLTA
jgi:DeoR family fructose operon transcriptional repressor